MRGLRDIRRALYLVARLLGDIIAVLAGPKKMVKRVGNKAIGRLLVKRLWFR